MKFIKSIIPVSLTLMVLLLSGCGSEDLSDKFRLNKKYWDLADYDSAIRNIRYGNKNEKKPCYAVAEKAPIFRKLVDKNNLSVIIEDDQLGINHRAEFTSRMFKHCQAMEEIYGDVDREDRFIYPVEFVDVLKFGLYLQLHYFDLGNEAIRESADDVEASNVKNVLRSNESTLVGNYCIYLGYIKQEKSLSQEALDNYIDGINEYFPQIIAKFPNANYSEMTRKITAMLKKTESEKVKTNLNDLQTKIDNRGV